MRFCYILIFSVACITVANPLPEFSLDSAFHDLTLADGSDKSSVSQISSAEPMYAGSLFSSDGLNLERAGVGDQVNTFPAISENTVLAGSQPLSPFTDARNTNNPCGSSSIKTNTKSTPREPAECTADFGNDSDDEREAGTEEVRTYAKSHEEIENKYCRAPQPHRVCCMGPMKDCADKTCTFVYQCIDCTLPF